MISLLFWFLLSSPASAYVPAPAISTQSVDANFLDISKRLRRLAVETKGLQTSTASLQSQVTAIVLSSGIQTTTFDAHTMSHSTHGATASNLPNRIMLRDANGGVSVSTITASTGTFQRITGGLGSAIRTDTSLEVDSAGTVVSTHLWVNSPSGVYISSTGGFRGNNLIRLVVDNSYVYLHSDSLDGTNPMFFIGTKNHYTGEGQLILRPFGDVKITNGVRADDAFQINGSAGVRISSAAINVDGGLGGNNLLSLILDNTNAYVRSDAYDSSPVPLILGTRNFYSNQLALQVDGTVSVGAGLSVASATVRSGEVRVSTATTSTVYSCYAGAFDILPTTGYPEGCDAYQISDHKKYVSTETVVGAQSWKGYW